MTWVMHSDEQGVFWCVSKMLINRNPSSPKDISLAMRRGLDRCTETPGGHVSLPTYRQ